METYTFLREFADSWFLIVLFAFFLGVWLFAFWPSLQPARDEAASIPLRDDTAHCADTTKNDMTKGLDDG